MLVDVISSLITSADNLIAIRFLHGTIGGISVGIGLSVIARTLNPDKIFGMLLVVQYSFGSLGIWTVPRLVESFGHMAVFGVLMLFSLMTLLILPFIPNVREAKSTNNPQKNPTKLSNTLSKLLKQQKNSNKSAKDHKRCDS